MIRELSRNNKTDWYEKIQLELDLQDLQIIYDAIGAIPPKYLEKKHKVTHFHKEEECYIEQLNDLYEDLYVIITEHNGVNDDNIMVNTEIELKLVGEENE